MELFQFVRNLDQSLNAFLQDYGTLTYLLLFTILFCETGLVVTPFLPGDSLLFTAGALAARPGSPLSIWLLSGVLMLRHLEENEAADRVFRAVCEVIREGLFTKKW